MTDMTLRAGRAPANRARIVCDGQSLMRSPNESINAARYLRHALGDCWVDNAAVNGTSITNLAADVDERLYPLVVPGELNILAGCYGQSDLGEGDTGQQIYDELVDYVAGARTAGFDLVVICTMPPSLFFVLNGWDDEWADFNTLVQNDPDNAFDAWCDWHTQGNLGGGSTAYFPDLVHFSDLAAHEAAGYLAVTIETLI